MVTDSLILDNARNAAQNKIRKIKNEVPEKQIEYILQNEIDRMYRGIDATGRAVESMILAVRRLG